jgi:adenylate cyclase
VDANWRGEPQAHLIMRAADGAHIVPIYDQLFIGRVCAGIAEERRLVINDLGISRNHLEIRLDAAADQAFIIDTSTNGTLLNGARLERAVLVPIRPNDEIRLGDIELRFRSDRFSAVAQPSTEMTLTRITERLMVMVVGDITNYSSISQVTDNTVIAESLNYLWHELRLLLRAYRGTLNHYAGDALYAVWDVHALPEANELAIDFALAANQRVEELAPGLALREPDGSPIRMGWAVVQGRAALAAMTRTVEAVIGDATNVAFRLAGIAGRGGHAAVMTTDAVHDVAEAKFLWGPPEQVTIKGRSGLQIAFPVIGRA